MPSRKSLIPAGPGRPRSQEARRAVLDAARYLLEKRGYAATTIEAIAAKSGVAKTTIYRGWQNRAALLIELLVEVVNEAAPPPNRSPSLQALRTELRLGAIALGGISGMLLNSLLGEAQQDPDVRTALLNGLFYPRREASVNAIKQAQALGELRSDVPPHVAVDLLFGPLFYRMFVQHEPVTEQFIRQTLRFTLEGLSTTA
ncbi:MAG: TetR/AcrR family transcriptional regulator [Gemmatimonadaceae bacterium]